MKTLGGRRYGRRTLGSCFGITELDLFEYGFKKAIKQFQDKKRKEKAVKKAKLWLLKR